MIDREITVFLYVFVGVARHGSGTQNKTDECGVTAQMCNARKYSNVCLAFVGNSGNEISRFVAGAAIDEVEAL
jgi:hypothetical protein